MFSFTLRKLLPPSSSKRPTINDIFPASCYRWRPTVTCALHFLMISVDPPLYRLHFLIVTSLYLRRRHFNQCSLRGSAADLILRRISLAPSGWGNSVIAQWISSVSSEQRSLFYDVQMTLVFAYKFPFSSPAISSPPIIASPISSPPILAANSLTSSLPQCTLFIRSNNRYTASMKVLRKHVWWIAMRNFHGVFSCC